MVNFLLCPIITISQGCKGARTPMYRAFAPFFMGVMGDRRVTGTAQSAAEKLLDS